MNLIDIVKNWLNKQPLFHNIEFCICSDELAGILLNNSLIGWINKDVVEIGNENIRLIASDPSFFRYLETILSETINGSKKSTVIVSFVN